MSGHHVSRTRGSAVLISLLIVLTGIGTTGVQAATARHHRAVASRHSQSVDEFARLHLVSRHGTNVSEFGNASGTYRGSLSLQIKAEENTLYFSFRYQGRSGEVDGSGSIHLHVADPKSTYTGTASASHGTGHFAHILARRLQVSGTIVTKTYATTFEVRGTISL